MPTCCLYARVSTAAQTDGASLASQIEACRAYALEQGFTVAKEVSETFSGHYLFDRPLLNSIRDDIRAGRYDALIVYDVDRLSRNTNHLGILFDECERFNTKLIFVQGDFENTPEGKLMQSVRAYAAETERLKIIERVTRGRRTKAKLGTLSFKRKLYGYILNDSGKREIFEPEAEIVRFIFSSFLEGGSLRAIASDLNNRQVPTPQGKNVWWAFSVAHILKNPAYAGRTIVFRQKKTSRFVAGRRVLSTHYTPETDHTELPNGTTPAIVSKKDFDKVQERFKTTKYKKRKVRKNEYLLRGFVRCGNCGRLMSPRVSYTFRGYVCTSKQSPTTNCGIRMMRANEAEELVWNYFSALVKNPKLIERLLKKSVKDKSQSELAAVRAQIDKLERERKTLVARAESVDDEMWQLFKERLEQKRKALEILNEKRAQLESEAADTIDLSDLPALARKIAPKIDNLSLNDKIDVLNMFQANMVWDGGDLTVYIGEITVLW